MLELVSRRCEVCGELMPATRCNRRFCSRQCLYVGPLLGKRLKDPTPAEIRERAAQIRATWTPEERAERTSPALRREPWTVPRFAETILTIPPDDG